MYTSSGSTLRPEVCTRMTPTTLYLTLLIACVACISVGVLVRMVYRRRVSPALAASFIRSKCSGEAHTSRLRRWIAKVLEIGHIERDGDVYTLVYHHGSTRHRIVFPIRRGPTRISAIVTERDGVEEDVTDSVREMMGPGHNFHGIPTTPRMLGYETLTIRRFGDTNPKKHASDDVIAL